MLPTQIYPCKLIDITGQSSDGRAQITELTSSERALRALKKGSIFFGIALLTIPVPMLHFILVPTFLLLSIGFFATTMAERQVVTKFEGPCPKCKTPIVMTGVFKISGTKETCHSCRQLLKIEFNQ